MKKNSRGRRPRRPEIRKRILSLVLTLSMLCAFIPCVNAATIVASGKCGIYAENNGKNLTWTLDSNGLLTISGKGEMKEGRNPNGTYFKYDNILWVKEGFYPNSEFDKKRDEYLLADKIKRVVINDGVTSIGDGSFWQCKNMESISIPNSVTEIDVCAFEDCSNLQSITIPNSVKSIGVSAFEMCEKLSNVKLPDGITEIQNGCFEFCYALKSIAIPDSVTSIGDGAFCESGLTTLPISKYVTHLDRNACGSRWDANDVPFQGYVVDKSNPVYSSLDGVLFSKDMTRLLSYPTGKRDKRYSIPEGVKEIGRYAFSNNTNISEIEAPSSIERVYECAIVPTYEQVEHNHYWDMIYKEIDLLYNGSEYQWNNLTAYYDGENDGYNNWSFTEGTIGECSTNKLLPNVNVKFMVVPKHFTVSG